MNNLKLADKYELALIPGKSVMIWNPDAFDEIALIECKKNRTNITLLEDSEMIDSSSKVIRALKDENFPKFSIDNDVLSSLLNRSSEIMEELITLLVYYQNLNQEVVDTLMSKIELLSKIYSVEYIMVELRNLSESNFETFIETDDTISWFKENVNV